MTWGRSLGRRYSAGRPWTPPPRPLPIRMEHRVIALLPRFLRPRSSRRSRIAAALRPKQPTITEIMRQPLFLNGGIAVAVWPPLLWP